MCAEAIDGGDAVEKTKESHPDLIVLDFQMPVMTGLQAAREIVKVAPDVPLLLCTAHLSQKSDRAGASGSGFKERFPNPVPRKFSLESAHCFVTNCFFCQPV